MGEDSISAEPLSFNGSLRIDWKEHGLTSCAGALLLREVDERLGITESLARRLVDIRAPAAVVHGLDEVLRTRLYLLALGFPDQSDSDDLRSDPALLAAASSRRGLGPLAEGRDGKAARLPSQPTISRLTSVLARADNLEALHAGVLDSAARDLQVRPRAALEAVTIDIDSFPITAHGEQPGSAYNGHYASRCFHPLIAMLAETKAILGGVLRPGNVHTAENAEEYLSSLIEKTEQTVAPVRAVRGDAGFPREPMLAMLEERGVSYAFRLKTNRAIEALARDHMPKRPAGRPPSEPREWFRELTYKAAPWSVPRRIVLVVLERPGQLLLDHFFLLTNWSPAQMQPKDLLEFYRQRGTFEGHIGEIKTVLSPALSCTTRTRKKSRRPAPRQREDAAKANEATFQLFLLAYNLMNTARRGLQDAERNEAEKEGGPTMAPEAAWSLGRFRARILQIAARVTTSGRRATFTVCSTAKRLWRLIWTAIKHHGSLVPDT